MRSLSSALATDVNVEVAPSAGRIAPGQVDRTGRAPQPGGASGLYAANLTRGLVRVKPMF